jgi:hypothetical protein
MMRTEHGAFIKSLSSFTGIGVGIDSESRIIPNEQTVQTSSIWGGNGPLVEGVIAILDENNLSEVDYSGLTLGGLAKSKLAIASAKKSADKTDFSKFIR